MGSEGKSGGFGRRANGQRFRLNALIRRDVKIPKGSGGWNQQSVGLIVRICNGPEAKKRPESGANRFGSGAERPNGQKRWSVRKMGIGRSVRHLSHLGETPGDRRDEDRNLVGAGNLGRGEPNSRFFETLEYREGTQEGNLTRTARKESRTTQDAEPGDRGGSGGGVAGGIGRREVSAGSRSLWRLEAGRGKAPGRMKPRRAGATPRRRDAEADAPTGRGMKPLKRGHADRKDRVPPGARASQ